MVENLGTIRYAADDGFQKPYSEKTAKMIDNEVKNIINRQYEVCRELIEKNKDKLEA